MKALSGDTRSYTTDAQMHKHTHTLKTLFYKDLDYLKNGIFRIGLNQDKQGHEKVFNIYIYGSGPVSLKNNNFL